MPAAAELSADSFKAPCMRLVFLLKAGATSGSSFFFGGVKDGKALTAMVYWMSLLVDVFSESVNGVIGFGVSGNDAI